MDKLNPAYLYLFFYRSEFYRYARFHSWGSSTELFTWDDMCDVNNEYSHLCGVFERGATPVEVPEMKKTVNLIIDKLKSDKDQFSSLLKSIGIELKEE